MSNLHRIMETAPCVPCPSLREQLRAAAIARREALSVTPSDYAGSALATMPLATSRRLFWIQTATTSRPSFGRANGGAGT
jgi:hypothetical protein